MWRWTFVQDRIFRPWDVLSVWSRRIERVGRSGADELNWARRRTFHELNSLSLARLMKSSMFWRRPKLQSFEIQFDDNVYGCDYCIMIVRVLSFQSNSFSYWIWMYSKYDVSYPPLMIQLSSSFCILFFHSTSVNWLSVCLSDICLLQWFTSTRLVI